jgi:DNA polymerase III subunit epsilon
VRTNVLVKEHLFAYGEWMAASPLLASGHAHGQAPARLFDEPPAPRRRREALPQQRSLDDLGTPLGNVTFCVIDIETTGGSAADGGITEIGAVKMRGGEFLGTFSTLINPGMAIPPQITVLTGITSSMVAPAPRIESVLPALVEFTAGTVLVGHNVRYDTGYLNAAFERAGWAPFPNTVIDTVPLARRLVRDEVPNCKLGTLAERFRLDHRPNHRALDDALATADLLHLLLERAARLGVLGLDDLIALPKLGGHPNVSKLKLTNNLPRLPGVYLFRGPRNEVLYVGKATNLRTRVRSYFSGDDRRKIGGLLREVQTFEHIVCSSTLEAAVLEVRLIHQHQPHYNRQAKVWDGYAYVRFSTNDPFPRLTVVRQPPSDGSVCLGPLASMAAARTVIDAIHSVVPLRRCSTRVGRQRRPARDALCTSAQIGVAQCPCTGELSEAEYAPAVALLLRALRDEPSLLLDPLERRMHELANAERFEEAANTRDRAAALCAALRRQHQFDQLRRAGRVELRLADGGGAELRNGVLVRAWGPDGVTGLPLAIETEPAVGPLPKNLADELLCVARWLDRSAETRIIQTDGQLSSALSQRTLIAKPFTPADDRSGSR